MSFGREMVTLKEEDTWEAIQLTSGETFIYHNGFKEDADAKDIFRFNAGYTQSKQIAYQFSRFDFNPLKPIENDKVRLNEATITLSWYIDPNSDVIRDLKKAILEMDANRAGLILPGRKG